MFSLSESFNSRLNLVQNCIKKEEIERDLKQCLSKLNVMQESLNSLNTLQEKTRSVLKNQQNTFDSINEIIESSQKRIEILEQVSVNNGHYLWKIKNVQKEIEEAQIRENICIHSPCFYTSQYGCKMRLLLFLNGDDHAFNTHLSVYISIMKGDYDAILKWPFEQEITFMLLDQSSTDNKEDIMCTFKPDPSSNSFKRPTSEMNILKAESYFCPLKIFKSTEREYIKDDFMFIKVKTC